MSTNTIQSRLEQLRSRQVSLLSTAALCRGILVLLGALTLIIWMDLAMELPPVLRILLSVTAVALVALVAYLPTRRARKLLTRAQLARTLDAAGEAHGEILSGSDLVEADDSAPGQNPMTCSLAQMAVERASGLAATVPLDKAAPASTVGPMIGTVLACLVVVAILSLAAPRLVSMQLARLVDPFGDHPAWSLVELKVDPGHTSVIYGQQLSITVTASGGELENAELVWSSEGSALQVLPMFREAAGQWRGIITEVTAPGLYLIRTPRVRSHRYNIAVSMVPRIGEVRFRITPPAYTRRPAYEGPVPQDGLSGLAGTKVDLLVSANRPLAGGRLELPAGTTSTPTTQPAAAVSLSPVAPEARQVAGSFDIQTSGKLTLSVCDAQGNWSTEPFTTRVTLLPDQRPVVRLLQPQPMSLASPSAMLAVQVSAEDDCGIAHVQVFRNLNYSRPRPNEVAVPIPLQTRADGTTVLPLRQFALAPGDVLQFFARAEDNDPAGAKGSETPTSVVQIISEEEMRQLQLAQAGLEMLMGKYQEVQRRTEALQAKLEDLEKAITEHGENSPEAKKAMAAANEALQQYEDRLDELMADQLPLEADKELKGEIGKLLAQAQKSRQLLARPGKGALAGAARQAREAMGQARSDYEQNAMDPLDKFAKAFALMEDQERFVDLYLRQEDLAKRLAAFRDRANIEDPSEKARLRDLEDEQRQVREDLAELLDRIESHVTELPADPFYDKLRRTAAAFAAKARASGAGEKMMDAEAAMARFAGHDGLQHAQSAAAILKALMSECKACNEEAGNSLCTPAFAPKLSGAMGATARQLLSGMGIGSFGRGRGQGGYSARGNTAQNVGLYGSRPLASQARQGVGASGGYGKGGQGGTGSRAGEGNAASASSGRAPGGATQIPIPGQYQRRVQDYYKRVADELGAQPVRNPRR